MGLIADYLPRAKALIGGRQNKRDAARHDLPETRGWNPGVGFAPARYEREMRTLMGRSRDLDENNAWINGGLDRRVEAVMGVDIRLMPQPKHKLLGQDFDWRMGWSQDVQDRHSAWANDVDHRNDVKRELTFGAQMRLAYLSYARDGAAAAQIRDIRRGLRNPTSVLLLEHDRIETPPDSKYKEGLQLRNGIARDANGAVTGYWLRSGNRDDPSPQASMPRWDFVPARGRTGRARMVHVFSPRRVEQDRGISKLAEVMIPAKMLDTVDRAEVHSALKAALLSIFIKAPGGTEDLEAALAPTGQEQSQDLWIEDYINYREDNPLYMDFAQLVQLLPGESVEAPERFSPNKDYPAFLQAVLQKVAAGLGISYPQISQNWADINYSSARALLNELWRSFLQDRHYFTQHFCTPIYAAWLEREIINGDVIMPGGLVNFYRQKTEICMASWIGPGRGSVDPLKEGNAQNLDEAAGRSSTPEHIIERGRDPQEVIAEQAHYERQREEAGLGPPNFNVKSPTDSASSDDTGGEESSEERTEEETAEEQEEVE